MTLLEMATETARRLREPRSGQMSGIYFSDEDIRDAVNEGYMELSDASEWFEEFVEIDLLKDRPYYDLFSLIGPVFLSIKPAFDESTNRWLIPSTVRNLDNHDRRWERVTNRPQRVFLRGYRWMGLYPRITSDGSGADNTALKVYYTRLPEPMCADTDEPGFPEAFHKGCIEFALTDLYAEDGETKLALEAWTKYLAYEADLSAWVNHRAARPSTMVMGTARIAR
ncbi:MAG TPA: hypothetical protein VF443_11195 [Nitrospira sp.]